MQFSGSRSPLLILVLYMYINYVDCGTAGKHELGLAESTGVDWDSFCREVCEITLLENGEKLGGYGKVVQIDESKFGKRKYHRGHHVEGQ